MAAAVTGGEARERPPLHGAIKDNEEQAIGILELAERIRLALAPAPELKPAPTPDRPTDASLDASCARTSVALIEIRRALNYVAGQLGVEF